MKNFKICILFALGLIVSACSVDDPLTVITQDTVERGAVLRTISNDPNAFLFDDLDSPWTITWEEQDIEDGGLLSSVDLLVNFDDGTDFNGTTTTTEAALMSVPASAFSIGPNGLPRTDLTVTYGEALSALGLAFDPDVVTGSDRIFIRAVLNLTDGRSFTNSDATGNVSGGSFFSSPYNYVANIVCPVKSGAPGTWTIEMQDSYGDGWNGASISVTLDGTTTDYLITAAQGSANTATFDVPADSEAMSIIFNSGAWDSEITFQITSANGNEILDLGTSPPAAVELLDYCADF